MRWKYFKREEFACHCGCGQNLMKDEVIDKLDILRDFVQFPLRVNSGYRCPAYNCKVATTGPNGPHTTGQSVDLDVNRKQAFKVMEQAIKLGFTGFGFKQKGTSRYLHLDNLPDAPGQPRPTVWSY